ncbi:MAG: hypothetical protein A07HR60_02360 [uncultured archaeon A07HR60]|nr:MAG: hypothetical protein A07HR60_02360 [uncultured archaeon A07HR60]
MREQDESATDTDENTAQESQSPLADARESLAAAETAHEAGEYADAVTRSETPVEQFTAIQGQLQPADERREAVEQGLAQARQQLRESRTRVETRSELAETLAAADGAVQTAVTAEADGDVTLARLRYRQAVQRYDSALATLAESAALLGENGLTIDRDTAADSAPVNLQALSAVDSETTFSQLGIDSAAELRAADSAQLTELGPLFGLAADGWREQEVTIAYSGSDAITEIRAAAQRRREQL